MGICASYNLPRVSEEVIRLHLFTIALMREDTLLLVELPHELITTWTELRT